MFVIKRNGRGKEVVKYQKIFDRVEWLVNNPYKLTGINIHELTQNVIAGLYDGVHTYELDLLAETLASSLGTKHIDYLKLASRIAVNNHHKNTNGSFSSKMHKLYTNKDVEGNYFPIIDKSFNKFIYSHRDVFDKHINYDKDYDYDYYGFKTLLDGYLLADSHDNIVESPQDMIMRIAIQIYYRSDLSIKTPNIIKKILHTYDMMSGMYYTHATPTLFNSGKINPSLSSCFLFQVGDSAEGILKHYYDIGLTSKECGGIGSNFTDVRGSGSLIHGTGGKSKGITPFLRVDNDLMRAFDQGGKRKGSEAVYLEPHHPEIIQFLGLNLKDAEADMNTRCLDLFTALWISDLFMERVQENGKWSTFSSSNCPGLTEVWGDDYKELYLKYENAGMAHGTYDAMAIWNAIKKSQSDGGTPYMLYKDTVNRSNMQSNIGVIKNSNLCAEIVEYSSLDETAVCNLASICLPKFVEDTYSSEELELPETERRTLDHEFPVNPKMNYRFLAEIAADVTENLNNVIELSNIPVVEGVRSNFKHRPIAIGIQGLADVFLKFGIAFESEKARDINKKISETIYYGSLSRSTEIAKSIYKEIVSKFNRDGGVYEHKLYNEKYLNKFPILQLENVLETYTTKEQIPKHIGAYSSYMMNGGSHISNGIFHWELCGLEKKDLSGMFDWDTLRDHIKIFGVRNSLTTAYMPTGTTSNIMGNSSCFEPYTTNIYKKSNKTGSFIIANKYLMKYLHDNNLYNNDLNEVVIKNGGSIQDIDGIPQEVKDLFKTSWEMKQSSLMRLAAERQPFIDQSQSMNLWFDNYTINHFSASQKFAWKNGLKTGSYYIKTRPAFEPQKITISPDICEKLTLAEIIKKNKEVVTNTTETEEEICLMCSS
jgi:ribonucleoside-diphosphate reductase alpha chain